VRAGLERTIEQYPDFAEAFACLSQIYCDAFRFGYVDPAAGRELLQKALALAHRAIELAPGSSRVHHALGLAYWFAGDVCAGMEALNRGRTLNPNDTSIMADLGQRYAILADWNNAVPLLETSFERNPAQPGNYRIGLALYYYAHGRFEDALSQAARVDAPHLIYGHIMVAVTAAMLGRRAEASAAVATILEIDPNYGIHLATDLMARNVHPELIGLIAEGLRQAGLPGLATGVKPTRKRL
jgi:tetratricopeptide (TPR) repeat protein